MIDETGVERLPAVNCLASPPHQAIMNLLVDAAQAVETPGTIKIRSGTLDAADNAGPRVSIEVADIGRDIPLATLKRFFEPFFPTQPVAKVTGLALSLAWGIVQKHHGMLEVLGEVGVGKAFRMTLPVNGDPPDAETGIAAAPNKAAPAGRRPPCHAGSACLLQPMN